VDVPCTHPSTGAKMALILQCLRMMHLLCGDISCKKDSTATPCLVDEMKEGTSMVFLVMVTEYSNGSLRVCRTPLK
jgi:hypothetical protein